MSQAPWRKALPSKKRVQPSKGLEAGRVQRGGNGMLVGRWRPHTWGRDPGGLQLPGGAWQEFWRRENVDPVLFRLGQEAPDWA